MLSAHLELYRQTVASLGGEERLAAQAAQKAAALAGAGAGAAAGTRSGGGGPPAASYHAAAAAREALLQGALARMGALHPGFRTPDGHYRVVREVADGLVGGRGEVPPECEVCQGGQGALRRVKCIR